MLLAQIDQDPLTTEMAADPLVVIFLFVAFCIVANLISKHLTMRHEQTQKFQETRKGHAQDDADRTGASSGPPWWYVLLTICAALAAGLFILRLNGGLSRLGVLEVIFIFAGFCVVANLISKHLKMKHEATLKQNGPQHIRARKEAELQAPEKSAMPYGSKVGILLALCSLVPLAVILLYFTGYRQPQFENVVGGFPAPKSVSSWTGDVPFDADQYPSIAACAGPLARQIVKEVQAINEAAMTAEATGEGGSALPAESTGVRVGHSGFSDSEYVDFVAALKEAFKSMKPNVFLAERDSNSPHFLFFRLKNVDQYEDAFPDKPIRLKRGDIACQWEEQLDSGQKKYFNERIAPVSFIEKPWLTDFAHFTSLYPESRFYIGATKGVESLKSKAHDRAVQDVANRLRVNAEQIEPQIAGRFTQTIERPYGKVYREAILVQNPPTVRASAGIVGAVAAAGMVAPAAASAQGSLLSRVVPAGPWSFEFSLSMIVCLTVVAGFISNVATQGYYRTKISNTVLAIAALVVASILLVVVSSIFA